MASEKRLGRKRTITPIVLCAVVMVIAGARQLSAQPTSQVSAQERGACRQDVRRFCQAELQRNPDDVLSITGCLQANRGKISRVCRNALARNGQ